MGFARKSAAPQQSLKANIRFAFFRPCGSKRYTMDDINAMLDEAEADFAAGKGIPDEEVWRKWDEELVREEQDLLVFIS